MPSRTDCLDTRSSFGAAVDVARVEPAVELLRGVGRPPTTCAHCHATASLRLRQSDICRGLFPRLSMSPELFRLGRCTASLRQSAVRSSQVRSEEEFGLSACAASARFNRDALHQAIDEHRVSSSETRLRDDHSQAPGPAAERTNFVVATEPHVKWIVPSPGRTSSNGGPTAYGPPCRGA